MTPVRTLRCGCFELSTRAYAPNTIMPRHAHFDDKISLVVRGGVEERVGGRPGLFAVGSVFVKPAGLEHADRVGPRGLRMLVVRRCGSSGDVDACWQAAAREYTQRLDETLWPLLFPLFLKLARGEEVSAGEDGDLFELLERLSHREHQARRAGPAWVGRVRDALHARFTGHVSVESLACELKTHPVYLTRAFRQATGRTIPQYVLRLRLGLALRFLADREIGQARIAADCGFADQAHFCRLFRRSLGITPGAYRAALGVADSGMV